ncbi:unnamed protein product [Peniophora sp. CBMAI 1063]|nr:unnamed protein product [Peniophora sp. CBMAI 1063]
MSTLSSPPSNLPGLDSQFRDADADIRLRSSDGIDFAVSRSILRLVSPVFIDMLSFPQSPLSTDSTSTPALVCMTEDSISLRLLLQFCYPRSFCQEPRLIAIMDIKRTAELARKFEIPFMRKASEDALLNYANVMPAVAYAVAWRYGYVGSLKSIAKKSLGRRDIFDGTDLITELDDVPASCLIPLIRYRSSVPDSLQDIIRGCQLTPIWWISANSINPIAVPEEDVGARLSCCCGKQTLWFQSCVHEPGPHTPQPRLVCGWWWTYVRTVVWTLQSLITLDVEDAIQDNMMDAIKGAALCSRCTASEVSTVLKNTTDRLRSVIELRLREIPFAAMDNAMHS